MDRRYKKKMDLYWAREERKNLAYLDRLDWSSWFDFWHLHPDWDARGNRYPVMRSAVANMTLRLFQYAESKAEGRVKPIQLWATFCEDTGDNAVYAHTENPNATSYPYDFAGVEWGQFPIAGLDSDADLSEYEIGRLNYEGSVQIILRQQGGET